MGSPVGDGGLLARGSYVPGRSGWRFGPSFRRWRIAGKKLVRFWVFSAGGSGLSSGSVSEDGWDTWGTSPVLESWRFGTSFRCRKTGPAPECVCLNLLVIWPPLGAISKVSHFGVSLGGVGIQFIWYRCVPRPDCGVCAARMCVCGVDGYTQGFEH